MAKDFIIVNGKVQRMGEVAYKIASRHFKATRNRPGNREILPELLKMSKLPIIPAVQKIEKIVEEPVKAEVKVEKPAEVIIPEAAKVTPVIESKPQEKPKAIKKPTRKAKK